MEHTQEQLANALQALGFQRTLYPSDKYQVLDNGTVRYLVDRQGNLRRGASVNSSIAANEAIADILRRAAETVAQQPQQQEGHAAQEQEADTDVKQTADNSPPQQPRQRGSSKQQVLVDLLTRHHRPDCRRHRLAGAQRARRHQRRTQEKAGVDRNLGKA